MDSDVAYVHEMRKRDKCRVIVVNNNYLKAPWADHLHCCDKQFIKWHIDNPVFSLINMTRTTLSNELEQPMIDLGFKILRISQSHGLCMGGDGVSTGSNSGYQAVNIAALYGAKDIFLLGYDHKPSNDGRTHWFGNHPSPTESSVFDGFLAHWGTLPSELDKHGIRVVNCSPDTALTMFEMKPITECF